jgi:hypothetical protein
MHQRSDETMSVPLDQMQLPDMPMLQPLSGPIFSQGLGAFLSSPQAVGMASALLRAGGPSRMPTSLGQALGSAMPYAQQYAQQNAQQQRTLQLQQALARLQQMSRSPYSGYTGGR